MESAKDITKHKGGRPRKDVKRSEQLAVMCTMVERIVIEHKAKAANISVSEFLRTLALKGQVDTRKKALPKEVLQAVGNIGHMSANVNQIAKKRNSFDELSPLERADLKWIADQLRQFIKDFKNYFR
jgi:hypothetical protein